MLAKPESKGLVPGFSGVPSSHVFTEGSPYRDFYKFTDPTMGAMSHDSECHHFGSENFNVNFVEQGGKCRHSDHAVPVSYH